MRTRTVRRATLLGLGLVASLGLLLSCGGQQEQQSTAKALPKVDGVIEEGEYEQHLRIDQVNMDLYWTIANDKIYFGLRSAAKGWLALGLDPTQGMKGADIIFGFVKDDQATVLDEYAPSISSHVPDTDLGGQDDLLQRAGREDSQGTTIEWVRRLLTGDLKDRSITAGRHVVMLAYSPSDDPTGYHGQAGKQRAIVFLDFFNP
jgi:hypothetical protein